MLWICKKKKHSNDCTWKCIILMKKVHFTLMHMHIIVLHCVIFTSNAWASNKSSWCTCVPKWFCSEWDHDSVTSFYIQLMDSTAHSLTSSYAQNSLLFSGGLATHWCDCWHDFYHLLNCKTQPVHKISVCMGALNESMRMENLQKLTFLVTYALYLLVKHCF